MSDQGVNSIDTESLLEEARDLERRRKTEVPDFRLPETVSAGLDYLSNLPAVFAVIGVGLGALVVFISGPSLWQLGASTALGWGGLAGLAYLVDQVHKAHIEAWKAHDHFASDVSHFAQRLLGKVRHLQKKTGRIGELADWSAAKHDRNVLTLLEVENDVIPDVDKLARGYAQTDERVEQMSKDLQDVASTLLTVDKLVGELAEELIVQPGESNSAQLLDSVSKIEQFMTSMGQFMESFKNAIGEISEEDRDVWLKQNSTLRKIKKEASEKTAALEAMVDRQRKEGTENGDTDGA